MESDFRLRGTACKDQFRWFATATTNTTQTARDLHDLSPISTLLMGRLLSAGAMMAWDLKDSLAELTLQLDGDGPLAGAMVVSSAAGTLKGYAKEPQLWLDKPEDNIAVGKMLGNGTLRVFRQEPGKMPYIGTIELVSGEIAEDIAFYYLQSEQIPTAVNLGVLIDKTAKVRASGGFIIQQLPNAEPKLADQIKANLDKTPNVSDLLDMGYSIEDILATFVFQGLDWQVNEQKEIAYSCNCNRDRFAKALLLLGKEELNSMLEGIKPVCHFCNKEYAFDTTDIKALLNELGKA